MAGNPVLPLEDKSEPQPVVNKKTGSQSCKCKELNSAKDHMSQEKDSELQVRPSLAPTLISALIDPEQKTQLCPDQISELQNKLSQ